MSTLQEDLDIARKFHAVAVQQRDAAWAESAARLARIYELEDALGRIERWYGEFPSTGRFWTNEDGSPSDRPMSYGAVNGSNGERDFMRAIARAALGGPQ